ncbi:MAG: hypothetical protein M1453_11520 [Acidobacteria bacterium]|nr:hypothetical protein [Acidobacteriota bacterium]MCL5288606.1 hypothetical protein [Acidobacteriota bacterium]
MSVISTGVLAELAAQDVESPQISEEDTQSGPADDVVPAELSAIGDCRLVEFIQLHAVIQIQPRLQEQENSASSAPRSPPV